MLADIFATETRRERERLQPFMLGDVVRIKAGVRPRFGWPPSVRHDAKGVVVHAGGSGGQGLASVDFLLPPSTRMRSTTPAGSAALQAPQDAQSASSWMCVVSELERTRPDDEMFWDSAIGDGPSARLELASPSSSLYTLTVAQLPNTALYCFLLQPLY